MNHISILQGVLRPILSGDLPDFVHHIDDESIASQLRSVPFPYSLANGKAFLEHLENEPTAVVMGIEIDNMICGAIGIHPQPGIYELNAELGYWVARRHWGKGIATQAVIAMTELAFRQKNVWRVFAGVYSSNPGSMRVLEKAGYTHRLTNRQNIVKAGRRLDECIFDAYADEWQVPAPETE